jgi:hypothetical protein
MRLGCVSGLPPRLLKASNRRPRAAGDQLGEGVDRHAVYGNAAAASERGELWLAHANRHLQLVRQSLDVHARDVIAVDLN